MSNPITSVQDPSEKDPLSGIITQVSPTSAGAPSRGGPARPTKVSKSTTEKKKKKQQAEKVTPEAGTSKSASAGTAEKKEEEDSGAAKGLDPNTGIRTTDEQSEEQSHSQNPSSTLVGTTTTKGSNILGETDNTEGLSKDKPTDAAATPTEPDPTVGTISRQSGSQAVDGQKSSAKLTNGGSSAQKSVRGGGGQASNTPQTTRPVVGTTNTNRSKSKMDEQTSRAKSEKSSEQGKKEKKKGGSGGGKFVAALIAFLTCSMGSAAVAKESEEVNEKRGSGSREKASSSNNNSKMPISPSKNAPRSVGKGASNRNSFDKTAGGGTKLPREETGDVMSGAVVPPGSSFVVQDPDGKKSGGSSQKGGDDDDDDDDEEGGDDEWLGDDQLEDDEDQTEEQRLIMQGGVGIPRDEHGNLQPLLGPIHEQDKGRKCLVLDLDETLVHSSFKMISNADFTVPVEIEGSVHNVYVIKRPGVDEFMRRMGEIYEVVVFTASLSKYADPVLDILDIHHVVRHRLFRESCYNHRGNYVKDLSQLGRDIETSIIIDNSPASYIFHPNNAVPISSWFNDPHDTELTDLCPFLAELAEVEDVRAVLDGGL